MFDSKFKFHQSFQALTPVKYAFYALIPGPLAGSPEYRLQMSRQGSANSTVGSQILTRIISTEFNVWCIVGHILEWKDEKMNEYINEFISIAAVLHFVYGTQHLI